MNWKGLMKRSGVVLTMTVCLSLPFSASAHAQSASFFASSLPWSSNMNVCFGGQLCGPNDRITVSTPGVQISTVRVFAHDNVGQTHKAVLELRVDGVPIGSRQDVKALGSYLTFRVERFGNQIVFRSFHEDGFSTEETVVTYIEVLP